MVKDSLGRSNAFLSQREWAVGASLRTERVKVALGVFGKNGFLLIRPRRSAPLYAFNEGAFRFEFGWYHGYFFVPSSLLGLLGAFLPPLCKGRGTIGTMVEGAKPV